MEAGPASAQRVPIVGDSSAGCFFYIVLGARAELLGLRLSLDSVGGLLRVAMLLAVARVSAVQEQPAQHPPVPPAPPPPPLGLLPQRQPHRRWPANREGWCYKSMLSHHCLA